MILDGIISSISLNSGLSDFLFTFALIFERVRILNLVSYFFPKDNSFFSLFYLITVNILLSGGIYMNVNALDYRRENTYFKKAKKKFGQLCCCLSDMYKLSMFFVGQ